MASSLELNKEYFNNEAANYDAKHGKIADRLIEEIRARLDFIGVDWVEEQDDDADGGDERQEKKDETVQQRAVRLLDYACGTGLVSRALAPYTTQCVGIDLSENMVAAYNTRAENQGLAPSEMRAYQGDLCAAGDPDPPAFASPAFRDFDVAAVGLGFHHFEDPALAARRLAARLRTGGVLVIVDFLPHGEMGHSHPASRTVTHHGFSEERIRRIFEEAGVGKDFALSKIADVFNFVSESDAKFQRAVFIARGTKA